MFEETEGKSIVTLVPAIFTERNTERKRKRCGKRGAMRKREKKGLQKKAHVGEQGASCIG